MLKPTKPIERRRRRWVGGTLAGARFHNVDLEGARFTGVLMDNVSIDGHIGSLTINGVDVGPLIRQALGDQHPELDLMESHDPDELREAWRLLRTQWTSTDEAAARLPEPALHEQVDDEWSYLETLRHLVYATDAWVARCALGRGGEAFWPAGLPNTDHPPWFTQACGIDLGATPSVAQIREVRRERVDLVTELLDALSAEQEAQRCPRNRAKAWPSRPEKHTVGEAIRVVLNEEWAHRRFAERDLAVLRGEARA